jgi:Fe-S cluster assembly protein SufD
LKLTEAETTLVAQLGARGAAAEAERLLGAGLPTRRVEAYHYTDLRQLLRSVPVLAEAGPATQGPLSIPGAVALSITNARVGPIPTLAQGLHGQKGQGGVLAQRDDVLVRLNSALAGEHLALEVKGAVTVPVVIDRRIEGAASHAAGAVKLFVADHASLTLIEVFSGSDAAHVGNHATAITLGKGANLTHITLNVMGPTATHFATNEYHLGAAAHLRTLVVQAGGALSRTQLFPTYEGEGATAAITGLNLVGDGQHVDLTMDALHAVPHTASKPLFKTIARGRSRAVVQGRLVVARNAQKTDAKLMAQGLMLSDEAEILTKPELEIYADDVVCGHGSTCGRLDEDHLFYLMSRGISKSVAETMLVRGFLAELIDPITDETVAALLHTLIDSWLER